MHRPAKVALAAAGILLLGGEALSQELRLPRKGSSPGVERRELYPDRRVAHRQAASRPRSGGSAGLSRDMLQEHDVIYCWRRAKRAKSTQDAARQNVVVGYLAGGLIGALITSSKNEEAYEDHKGDARKKAFDRCVANLRKGGEDDEE
jgi:hypothetical protein